MGDPSKHHSPVTINESLLIEQIKRGDETAFKQLVEAWEDMVYNTALGLVQQAEDAEDVAQDAFVQVFQSIHTFKGESKFSTWLYRITVSKSLDHLRKKKRKKRFAVIRNLFGEGSRLLEDPPDFHHPGVAMDQKENAAELWKAISKLPENQRIAFSLHKVEGLSYQEISEIMRISLPAVESLIHRGKLNLRNSLSVYYHKNR